MQQPLVTIICISFNHSKYIEDSLTAIRDLEYPNIQLIIADDASVDDSQKIIKSITVDVECELVLNLQNIGHCKTFNKALTLAKGEFIIDLAADDILLPNSIGVGVKELTQRGEKYGVFYADAEIIDSSGRITGKHLTQSFFKNGLVPKGDIYKALLGKYFLNPVTMIYRTSMVVNLGGYDENLEYEDFDFWIRSSRTYYYCYQPIITVQRRTLANSASTNQYIRNSRMLGSTLKVCNKAFKLNVNRQEDIALFKRVAFEGKMSLGSSNYSVALQLFFLGIKAFFKIRL